MTLDKFREADFRNQILQAGDKILWLGRLDESWAKYLVGAVGPGGKILWIDREGGLMELPPNVVYLREDIQRCDLSILKGHATLYDVVAFGISDDRQPPDSDRMDVVFEIIQMYLKREGTFLTCTASDASRWEDQLKGEFGAVLVKEPDSDLLVASDYKRNS